MRWGLGPVFFYECLANSRRWQTYAIRSVGVALLLAAIAMIAMSHMRFDRTYAWREYAALGVSYFYAVIGVELTLVMLAAPAATAGAICVDRARGTLTHMLATDLSDPEIVLGKLAARLLPVLGLVACSWPVLALSSLLGGIDPLALTLAFAIILAVALLGCSLALSVWARKPHEVVLVVYTFWALLLLLWPIWYALALARVVGPVARWSLVADPYYLAFAPYSAPGRLDSWDYVGFFAATLGASVVLVVLAVWRMRPVARRGTDEGRKGPRLGWVGRLTRWLPGPALDGNPVFWREWHRSRPSRWTTILIVLVGGSTGIACAVGAVTVLTEGIAVRSGAPPAGLIVGVGGAILQLIFGLLVLSAVAPTSMAEERQRGSLDLLAATTLSTPTIVVGKWLGTLRQVALLAIGPGLVGLALALAVKFPWTPPPGLPARYYEELSEGVVLFGVGLLVATILVHGALIASAGLALAVWIARQGRAIAMSVGFAVTVAAGWPILVGVMSMGPLTTGLWCLSPVVAGINLLLFVVAPRGQESEVLWWIAFWDIECLALALGLLWLTVRTFDGCFDRIPDRPGRAPVLADVVVVLAGLIDIGGLVGGIAAWINGVGNEMQLVDTSVSACILLVAVGFVLLTALAASSMSISPAGTSPALAPVSAAAIPSRKSFAIRWWEAFRLVLLLAIGPALVALALVAAPIAFRVATKVKPLPGGGSVTIETDSWGNTYVTTTDASGRTRARIATDAEIAEAGQALPTQTRGALLAIAALAIVTVVAHAAAYVSLGAALGVWIRRRDRAIAASVGLVLLVMVGWPIAYINIFYERGNPPWGLALASVLPAYSGLLFHRDSPAEIADTSAWVAYWDVILILSAAVISGLAIRTVGRRSREGSPAEADAEDASLRPAGGESAIAAIWKGEKST